MREWKWFIIPHRPKAELCSIDVYDKVDYVWRLKSAGKCAEDAIPIAYGAKPLGFITLKDAMPLQPNVRYGVSVESWEIGEANFLVSSDPKEGLVRLYSNDGRYVMDPEQRRFMEARERRIAELQKQGLSYDQAFDQFFKERESEVQMSASTPTAPAAPASNATAP